jgi:hypothetical protein
VGHPPNSHFCQSPSPITWGQGHQGKACTVGGSGLAGGHEVDMIQAGRFQVMKDKAVGGGIQDGGWGWGMWSA